MKRLPWFEIILIFVIVSISLYGAFSDGHNFSRRWFTRDDAYYYFKVAQNISEGRGSTFDGINETNGYHPLWMLICIPIFALARFDLILPLRVLFLVMNGLSLATGILLYRLIGKIFAPAIGALAALYWIFSPDVVNRVYQQGLETGIAAFFIVLFVYKLSAWERTWRKRTISRKDLALLGLLGLCAILSRLDLIFFIGIAGIWIVFRRNPLRYLLPLDIVSIVFSVLLAFVSKFSLDEYYSIAHEAVKMLTVSLALKIPLAYIFGLYQRNRLARLQGLISSLVSFVLASSVILSVAMIAISRLLDFDNFPRMLLLYDALSTALLIGLPRLLLIGLKTSEDNVLEADAPFDILRRNWREWVQDGIIYYGIAFGGLAIYMVWNKFVFGTFSPVSGQIKRWWGSFPGRVYGGPARSIPSFFGIDYTGDANAWYPISTVFGRWAEHLYKLRILDIWRYVLILVLFALLFYAVLLIHRKKAKSAVAQLSVIPLLCGCWLQVFYYHAQGYSAYKEWYWITQLILVVIVFGFIFGMIYQLFRRIQYVSRIVWAVAVFLGAYMIAGYWSSIRAVMTYNEWSADEPYMDLVAFLEKHTEPGSIIGLTGGGNVGYFIHDRTIINMDGLINSYQYFELLKKKEAGKYLAQVGMDYILASMDLLDGLPYRGQYKPYVDWMDINYGGKDLVHYHSAVEP